ncbi:MAG: hypothetical protein ACOCQX_00590 [Candidatus Nanoarchaeia archaeon]
MLKEKNRFGTFSGVFVPSALAILGAVMYYITPQVVAGVGLTKSIIIIALAHLITLTTAVSMAGIASNIEVKGGGLYYIISRSLGLGFGGSTGILLYLAQTVSIAFYSVAFARAVAGILSRFDIILPAIIVSVASFIIFGLLAFRGAKQVIRFQILIFVIIIISILSILFGPGVSTGSIQQVETLPFWVGFAMFFPAVTGISAGIGMSGDLKNPSKSLIIGTFCAIGFTVIIYILLAFKLSLSAPASLLLNDKYIVEKIALFAPLVILGVLAATSSSALSLFMAAPRTLRAMVKDRLFGRKFSFLGKSIGNDTQEPRIAIIFTALIGFIFLFAGGLEKISVILTIFFLSVYGWVNTAAFLEKISKNPSYRPSFDYPALVPFIGMLTCYLAMFFFNFYIGIFVIFLQIVIYKWTKKDSTQVEGLWKGLQFQLLKDSLKSTGNSENSKKNYRPIVVAVSTRKKTMLPMLKLLNWICSNKTVSNFYLFIKGRIREKARKREEVLQEIRQYTDKTNVNIFPRVIITRDFPESIRDIIQSESAGHLPFNTVMFDFNEIFSLHNLIYEIRQLKKNVIVYREQSYMGDNKTIDVWWNKPDNGNFMLLLAHLISTSPEWQNNQPIIRVLKVVRKKREYKATYKLLHGIIEKARLRNVKVQLIYRKDDTMDSIIYEFSKNTDLVLLGIPHYKSPSLRKHMVQNTRIYTDHLKKSLIIQAHDKIDLSVS